MTDKVLLINNTNGTIEIELGLKNQELLLIQPFSSVEVNKSLLEHKRIKNLLAIKSLFTKEIKNEVLN